MMQRFFPNPDPDMIVPFKVNKPHEYIVLRKDIRNRKFDLIIDENSKKTILTTINQCENRNNDIIKGKPLKLTNVTYINVIYEYGQIIIYDDDVNIVSGPDTQLLNHKIKFIIVVIEKIIKDKYKYIFELKRKKN